MGDEPRGVKRGACNDLEGLTCHLLFTNGDMTYDHIPRQVQNGKQPWKS